MAQLNLSDAYKILHDGSLALSVVEANGMRVDVDRLNASIQDVSDRIDQAVAKQKSSDVWEMWTRKFGHKANMDSRVQLAAILFGSKEDGGLGYRVKEKTATNRPKTDDAVLSKIDHPFIKTFLRIQKLIKLRSTYLNGLKREVVKGAVHPMFNLHLVTTYRSSCDTPNLQNVPIRDDEAGRLVRSCFVPRDGHVLVCCDYSALEFRICASFWGDEAMLAYASDPDRDIHRDMAAECFLLDEVPKDCRFYAKNQFVFPILYGSYYVNCTKNLWDAIANSGLRTSDGMCLYRHLEEHGIDERGLCDPKIPPQPDTFERHIKSVEASFNEKFPRWSERKDIWQKRYTDRGWFRTKTGFRCSGVYSRNEIYNYPIQGPAFHCLLWSLTRVVEWLRKKKMKSLVVGQIHDDLIADVHESELQDYVDAVRRIMTIDIRKHWSWIKTPLDVEVSVCRDSWYEKEDYGGR